MYESRVELADTNTLTAWHPLSSWMTMLPSALFTALFILMTDTLDTVSIQVDVAQLIRRAQQGDREAMSMLYRAYVQSIFRYAVARLQNSADAEDVTSDVFISMVEELPLYQITEAPFASWLYRIASSRVADYYRKQSRHPETELTEMLPDDLTLPEEQILHNQSFDTLRDALKQLSDEHQNILILRFVDRKSHEEVAAILGKSMTAVKSAQHRALAQLTELLGVDGKSRHYLRGAHE